MFEDYVHKRLLAFIKQCYEQDGIIGTYKITAHFHDDEESDTIARILALDNRPDDLDKAYGDYMKIISDEMQKNMVKGLIGSDGDLEKLNELLKRKR